MVNIKHRKLCLRCSNWLDPLQTTPGLLPPCRDWGWNHACSPCTAPAGSYLQPGRQTVHSVLRLERLPVKHSSPGEGWISARKSCLRAMLSCKCLSEDSLAHFYPTVQLLFLTIHLLLLEKQNARAANMLICIWAPTSPFPYIIISAQLFPRAFFSSLLCLCQRWASLCAPLNYLLGSISVQSFNQTEFRLRSLSH